MKRRVETITFDGHTLEYSVTGKGAPIIVMHGGHSNCYEEFGYTSLVEHGYSIITPSRPGYGRTSKEIGKSLADACRFYVKLLDHLQIDSVHVIAISAGGPSGIYFASHYPERTNTLTLQSAVTKEWLTPQDTEYKVGRILFRPPVEKWLWKLASSLNNAFPRLMFRAMSPQFSTLSFQRIKSMMDEKDIEAFRKMNSRQRSGEGFLLDLPQTAAVSSKELQAITCPVLIMQSVYDGFVDSSHAHHAKEHIPDAALCLIHSWGHLIWLGKEAAETDRIILEFLES
ncbi:alpha/beta hydrolase [Bacillus inaquosorum]|uniref:alpha/beta fold hydrolase n=1 Tax=Bacillus inaquosorum TaxID=483913 RepID=UPI000A11F266|nr:alpha/beta hydrolase [Bacillus inaquosorum]QJC87254.1 Aromatic hydrocarbon catabolism protein [Bacillus subtilis]QYX43854.1 alpha/beta hydrolase [Bacillus inaquosorum]WNW25980.1 alpha/beta hydrolase [Bacillus inaquosorum]